MAQEEASAPKARRPTVAVIQEEAGGAGGAGGAGRRESTATGGSRGSTGQRRGTSTSDSLRKAAQLRGAESSSSRSTMRRVVHARNSLVVNPPIGSTNPSLTIYREQYCCLSRRTRLERLLFALVTLLAVVILLLFLIVMLVILPQGRDDEEHSEPLFRRALPWTNIGDSW